MICRFSLCGTVWSKTRNFFNLGAEIMFFENFERSMQSEEFFSKNVDFGSLVPSRATTGANNSILSHCDPQTRQSPVCSPLLHTLKK